MDSWKKFDDKHWSTGWFDQKTITFKGSGGQWKTAYGGIPMRCVGGNNGIHEFVLKIVNGRDIIIGIDDGRDNVECIFSDSSSYHYGLYSDGHFYEKDGKSRYCGMKFKAGDTVRIWVDLHNASIHYDINTEEYKELAKIQQVNTPYYLAVAMSGNGSKITLVNHLYYEQANMEVKELDDEQQEDISMANAKVESLEQMVRELRSQNISLLDENERLKLQFAAAQTELQRYQEEEKEWKTEIEKLRKENRRLKLQHLDTANYDKWGPDEITSWILSLDGGRFIKYETTLRKSLEDEEVEGDMLGKVDGGDLKRWGIAKFSDFKFLLGQIDVLIGKSAAAKPDPSAAVMPVEGAATVHI